MTLIQVLLSLFTLLCTAIACTAMQRSRGNADDAHDAARAVARTMTRVDAHDEEIAVVSKRLSKLTGRFYNERRGKKPVDDDEPHEFPRDAGNDDPDDDFQAMMNLQKSRAAGAPQES